jgi:hypothetical protein
MGPAFFEKFLSAESPKSRREPRALRHKIQKTKCRMSILTIRHPALQSMCSKD